MEHEVSDHQSHMMTIDVKQQKKKNIFFVNGIIYLVLKFFKFKQTL